MKKFTFSSHLTFCYDHFRKIGRMNGTINQLNLAMKEEKRGVMAVGYFPKHSPSWENGLYNMNLRHPLYEQYITEIKNHTEGLN